MFLNRYPEGDLVPGNHLIPFECRPAIKDLFYDSILVHATFREDAISGAGAGALAPGDVLAHGTS